MKPTNTDAILAAAILGAMANNLKETPKKDLRKEGKAWAEQIRELYLGIMDAGFDEAEAFELTLTVLNSK